MQIHDLKNQGKKKKKRVGRGGKRGTTAGRGTKGQKARSGGNVNPLFEGGRSSLTQRMKKRRGFKSPHPKKEVFSLTMIDVSFKDGETVSLATLVEKGLLRKRNVSHGARIVATGTCTKKVTISDEISMTEAAAKALGATNSKQAQSSVKKEQTSTKK